MKTFWESQPTWTGFTVTAVTLSSWTNQRAVSPTVHGCRVGTISVPELYAPTARHGTRGPSWPIVVTSVHYNKYRINVATGCTDRQRQYLNNNFTCLYIFLFLPSFFFHAKGLRSYWNLHNAENEIKDIFSERPRTSPDEVCDWRMKQSMIQHKQYPW